MKVREKFFSDLYHQICLITSNDIVNHIDTSKIFDASLEEELNGFLTYAYIEENNFVFEILAGSKFLKDRLKTFIANTKIKFKFKRSEIDSAEVKILGGNYSVAFKDRIQIINDKYSIDSEKEKTRLIKNLDLFRHPDYPDDVAVYFLGENFAPEQLWVRCRAVVGNILNGELLVEPKQKTNLKIGANVNFGIAQVNGQKILMCLL